jgi:hypothetical protein
MKILGQHGVYHKVVYEVRYDQGFIYLDRCGTTSNRIVQNFPDWIVSAQNVNPQQAPFVHAITGNKFNFGPLKYDFSLDQRINADAAIGKDDIDDFVRDIESVTAIVHEELELKQFTREGFRIWYVFPTKSDQDSRDWICKLRGVSIHNRLVQAFSGELESLGYTIAINSDDRKFRISVNPVERTEQLDLGSEALRVLPRNLPKKQREHLLEQLKAKHRLLVNPQIGVMIDVDAFVEDPIEIAPTDFITESLKRIEQSLPAALSGSGL